MRLIQAALISLAFCMAAGADSFEMNWPDIERTWTGRECWANRLQDWRVNEGRFECVEDRADKPVRTVHLLTYRLSEEPADFDLSVTLGRLEPGGTLSSGAWAGLLIGGGAPELDVRAAALEHHLPGGGGGLIAAVDGQGRVAFFDHSQPDDGNASWPKRLASDRKHNPNRALDAPHGIFFTLEARWLGEHYTLKATAFDPQSGALLSFASLSGIEPERLQGNLALASNPGGTNDRARFWFGQWRGHGEPIHKNAQAAWGPVLSVQYTLHDDILKLTAQLPPLGAEDKPTARLEILAEDGRWRTADIRRWIAPGYTAPFRVEEWDSSRDWRYRVIYSLIEADGGREYAYEGIIRRDPVDKQQIVVAGFTGNNNVGHGADRDRGQEGAGAAIRWTQENIWFPHQDIVDHVSEHNPDLLFFSGDQVYEGFSPTLPDWQRPDEYDLDYLYKWYLWCWAFGPITRDRPTVCVPDDHDVYHGNVWGWEGRETPEGREWVQGGYAMPAEFVNMVQRTQCSHLPDPYNPEPVLQGISVYYTDFNWGGVGFAVIEDRKFKSPPAILSDVKLDRGGHITDASFDTLLADLPEAQLLGRRQMDFLDDWTQDWHGHSMKCILSQTIFCNLQTRDDYPDKLDRDLDSNGWPQSKRNAALELMRRGLAFHLAGDQHLGSTVQHGIDDWGDAGFSLCVPSIANFYVRFWEPPTPGPDNKPWLPKITGEFHDGLQNKITVWAAANPIRPSELNDNVTIEEPVELHRKTPGYGIVTFDKRWQTIEMANWPRYADPGDGEPYTGWPIRIRMEDNYGGRSVPLPMVSVRNAENAVVQIIDEDSGELVYSIRMTGSEYRPMVAREGRYTVRAGLPEENRWAEKTRIKTVGQTSRKSISFGL